MADAATRGVTVRESKKRRVREWKEARRPLGISRARGRAHRDTWRQKEVLGSAWSPRRQNIGHLVGVGEGEVGAGLGRICADLDLGPKMKFVHLGLLYIFH